MSHSLSDSQWLGIAKFLVIGIAVPVAYVLLNVVVRRNLYGPRVDNWFCGLDLSLATLVALGLWVLEPPTRFLTPLPLLPTWMTVLKAQYGAGIAMLIDVYIAFYTYGIQEDYVRHEAKIRNPSMSIKARIVFKHLVLSNAAGMIAFAVTAFLIRG